MNDFIMNNPHSHMLHDELFSLFAIAIEAATEQHVSKITDLRDTEGATFSRDHFFELSGILGFTDTYYIYDLNKITKESWDYFRSFVSEDTLIIGCELGLDLRKKLTSLGYIYINFWFHSYKLFPDAIFMAGTNLEEIFHLIESFKIPKYKFSFFAQYYTNLIKHKNLLSQFPPIEENSCVFIGQTLCDKSIERDGQFLNITDFPEAIAQIEKNFSTIYYVPHPYAQGNEQIQNFLEQHPKIQQLNDIPTYYLLATPQIKKIFSISSSVLFEAAFFGKEIEYFYQPLFAIDAPFSLNTFISLYHDYWTPGFWRKILSPIMKLPNIEFPSIDFSTSPNMARELIGYYYGFHYLDKDCLRDDALTACSRRLQLIEEKMLLSEGRITENSACLQNVHTMLNEYKIHLDALEKHDEFQQNRLSRILSLISDLSARTLRGLKSIFLNNQ